MIEKIKEYIVEAQSFTTDNKETLENFRIQYLGSKGLLKELFAEFKNVPNEQKKEFGQVINQLKTVAEEKVKSIQDALESKESAVGIYGDLSRPGEPMNMGSRHPISIVKNQMIDIFSTIGFNVSEGPEIEDDWHNFGAMNLPEDHPARDMQDTFYIQQNPDWLLRTHTSSVQARVMETQKPPIRVICPGRVYRNETISARAHCFFHQVEGLYIDENVSFADLKQTLYFFVQEMFGKDVKVRFRPSYFPFTEPSAEMDISCQICSGKGCNICKHTGWVEILGSGMVHPKVLENFGIDSTKYTGFAFGMGVERITQLKYQVNDLRLYSQNDMRFLKQFTGAL